jgi:hypothetical protein
MSRWKASEIPRKEAYVKGIRHKAKGTWIKKQFIDFP